MIQGKTGWILHYEKARLAGGNACDDIRLATKVVGRIHSIYPLKPPSPCLMVNVIGPLLLRTQTAVSPIIVVK